MLNRRSIACRYQGGNIGHQDWSLHCFSLVDNSRGDQSTRILLLLSLVDTRKHAECPDNNAQNLQRNNHLDY